jgi:hypothetical protein
MRPSRSANRTAPSLPLWPGAYTLYGLDDDGISIEPPVSFSYPPGPVKLEYSFDQGQTWTFKAALPDSVDFVSCNPSGSYLQYRISQTTVEDRVSNILYY